jgi:hypothetical protein
MIHHASTTAPPLPANDTAGLNQTSRRPSWPRVALFIGLLVGATTAGYFAFPKQDATNPELSLVADPLVFQAGECGQCETVAVQFTLKNQYAEPVEIHSVVTSCGCIVPTVSRKHLAPGQESTLRLDWYTGARRGPVAQSIWVFHSIPGNPPESGGRMQLGIEGNVVPDIQISPTQVEFTAGRAGTARLTLALRRGDCRRSRSERPTRTPRRSPPSTSPSRPRSK